MHNHEPIVSKLVETNSGLKNIKNKYFDQMVLFPNSFDPEGYEDLIKKLDENEERARARIFQVLQSDIKMSVSKAQMKFPNIPLEANDFLTEGWSSLSEALKKFNPRKSDRGFSKYYLEIVYWRSMDYIRKFLTNKHKAVNLAITRSSLNSSFDFDFVDLVESDPWKYNNIMSMIREYVKNCNGMEKDILTNYLIGENIETIATKVNRDKRATQRKLQIALSNLKRKLA
ncbi:hypothetical protein [Spiroplasma endosymbiont of Panorpa germanica]|uniref:hypothetical protein n=1 Tax=Spiroplasma endosymbiont of Panorpa germanica TaxID=3066314 RepID=UPI0030D0FD6B